MSQQVEFLIFQGLLFGIKEGAPFWAIFTIAGCLTADLALARLMDQLGALNYAGRINILNVAYRRSSRDAV